MTAKLHFCSIHCGYCSTRIFTKICHDRNFTENLVIFTEYQHDITYMPIVNHYHRRRRRHHHLSVQLGLYTEQVSVAGAADFPHSAQTHFCDSPLRSPLRDLPLQ